MENQIVIKVNNLKKNYKLYNKNVDRIKELAKIKNYHRDFFALDGINFEICKGESVGIIGTNGSGKSTLLKIITGVAAASSGYVEVYGKISALLELGAGFNPNYTGVENIYLNGTVMGYTREEMETKVKDIISFADIGDFIEQPVKNYSSGMFARLAFAVAINVEPDILIVDEALSVGDVFFQNKCYKKMDELREKGITILMVSHDMNSISKYCNRAILINRGIQIIDGPPKVVVDVYKKMLVGQLESKSEEEKSDDLIDVDKPLLKSMLQLNPAIVEYGTKEAIIYDFAVFDDQNQINSTLIKNTEFKIAIKVEFFEDIASPIFAFTIKDIKGNELTGTNTMIEKEDIYNIKKGEKITVSFKQEINLQGGVYLLSLGCTTFESSEFKVYHRLYDVCTITVISDKDSVGIFDMNSQIRIER